MCCGNFGRLNGRKFNKIITKAKTKRQNVYRDDSKTIFHHCILHSTSLRGLGVKMNAKATFKT